MINEIINYGINKNYLPNWTIKDALREIYQNFIDYGKYNSEIIENIKIDNKNHVVVEISNDFIPTNYDFLAIGNTNKLEDTSKIGQHGEGLKMAFLIFLRENLEIYLYCKDKVLNPIFTKTLIGETLSLKINPSVSLNKFSIVFTILEETYYEFISNIVVDTDIIFNYPTIGAKVNKKVGNIYSGGLFVCHLDNIKLGAYNIHPSELKLDRDRRVPGIFDINWATSVINSKENKYNIVDTNYDDTKYLSNFPPHLFTQVSPVIIDETIQFKYKDNNSKTQIVKNDNVINHLKNSTFFEKIIFKLKQQIFKNLGILELLEQFENKYIPQNSEMKKDFDIIKLKINK